jgi:uncharacterized protein with von Willebrand factor type A (vWA) domain
MKHSNNIYYKDYAYLRYQAGNNDNNDEILNKEIMNKLMSAIGREVIRERSITNEELENILTNVLKNENVDKDKIKNQEGDNLPIINYIKSKGYLKDSNKRLTRKGFDSIGFMILKDIMKVLKDTDLGFHEIPKYGEGITLLDTTKPYEISNDIRFINVPKTLLNTVQRLAKHSKELTIPLDIDIEDFEEYERLEDVRTSIVYCIDLSSTMRYSVAGSDMSRIEVAKRALWGLYVLNEKFFPTDSIHIIGFGALASVIKPEDIPYLKTFEPGNDFLHYTNYQAAFRLAKKILYKENAVNKRVVLITDGHPSACFIDNEHEKERLLASRSYTHFYKPDKNTLENVKKMNMKIDTSIGDLVYLCYRYKKVDPYIGDKTIIDAKKCHNCGIEIDTIMVSEEDSLLSYINNMEREVKGRSYYINPADLEHVLITDYIQHIRRKVNTI